MFVDDEFLVCNFLRSLIPWEKKGYTICGEAHNGREALEMISSLKPDIALIDISMPVMDGIELMRSIRQSDNSLEIIILSSYSDYDYVRETLRLGAIDYLLKHRLDAGELIRVLDSAREKITGSLPKASDKLPPEESASPLPVICESDIPSFLEGKMYAPSSSVLHMRNIIVSIAEIHMPIGSMWDGAKYENKPVSLVKSILSMCQQILSNANDVKIACMGSNRLAFLFPALAGEEEVHQESRVACCMGVIKDAVLKYHNIYMIWSASKRCIEPGHLPGSYAEAVGRLRDFPSTQNSNSIPSSLTLEQERNIISCVYKGDASRLHAILYEILAPFGNDRLYRTALQLLASDILTLAVKLYRQRGIRLNVVQETGINIGDIAQIATWLENIFVQLINSNNSDRQKWSDTVQHALAFLEKNYNRDVSLMDVAGNCNVNSAYLSHLFKKEVGMGLNQCLNRIRISHAMKMMLLDDVQISLVYQQVGFNNYNHFFNTFKAITGISPTAFRSEKSSFEYMLSFDPLQK